MKRLCYLAAALLAVSFASRAVAQNQLANPGFELPTTTNVSIGNWLRFGSGAQGLSNDSTAMPHSGQGHIDLETLLTGNPPGNQFAGAYQDLIIPVNPGQLATFTGWHKSVGPSPFAADTEIKLEWQGPSTPDVLDKTWIPTADYTMFTVSGIAPPTTTGLRVTYAIATFGAGQGVAEVYIDDFSVTVIPEPATAGMLGLGLLGLARIRRRK